MRTLIAAALVTLSSTAFAGDVGGTPCTSAESASDQTIPNTVVAVIVRPDGGGLGADPDVGTPAMTPDDPTTLADTPGR